MSTTSPSTPENTPFRRMPVNRSFTLPVKMATTSRNNATAEIGATDGVETLYIHPNGKIVKFVCAGGSRPGSSLGSANTQQGTLPWATLTEQTLAAGPLQIYRVPGSVSFLHSGSLLHAIMPRSNCWCVDGVSKFAIRVLADTYYRIELPGESPEDLEKVGEFKETLKKVLFFERTACPFARTFSVELPDEPEVKKKRRKSYGPAKKWKLEKAYSWKPEDGGEPPKDSEEYTSGIESEDDDSISCEDTMGLEDTVKALKVSKLKTPTRPSVRERAMGLNLRSVTAPPQMAVQTTPPSRLRKSRATDESIAVQASSDSPNPDTSSATAVRPFQSIPTAMPPSPPDSSAGYDYTEQTTSHAVAEMDVHSQEQTHLKYTASNAQSRICNKGGTAAAEETALGADEWRESSNVVDAQNGDEPGPDATPSATAIAFNEDPDTAVELEPSSCGLTTTSSRERSPQQEPESLGAKRSKSAASCAHEDANAAIDYLALHSDRHAAQSVIPAEFPRDESSIAGADDTSPTARDTNHAGLQRSSEQRLKSENGEVDPFAQIQARIQARRSIGGTTSFHPSMKSPTRQSSVSTASSSSLSTRSGASSASRAAQQQQQALATALVKKACSVFLGPPAQLVMIMLRIAARFAKGAFPRSFLFESPAGMAKRVPGSFDLDGSDVEDFGLDDDLEWDEDDFGVPLRSPVRLATLHESLARSLSQDGLTTGAGTRTARERRPKGWDVD